LLLSWTQFLELLAAPELGLTVRAAFMRIIGGTAGGRLLKVPKGLDVRPTPDLVRQAIFNSLGARVAGARVLELFGGSGALSLECLSRGAAAAICVEKSPKHAAFIRENAQTINLAEGGFHVRTMDAFDALRQMAGMERKFDLVLADPPYGDKNVLRRSESFAQRLLDDIHLPALLAPGGLLVLGHARRDQLEIPAGWHERKVLQHGDSIFRMLEVAPPASRPQEPGI
jgi:16S rRNA (guanine966-N2)-methyltransferase